MSDELENKIMSEEKNDNINNQGKKIDKPFIILVAILVSILLIFIYLNNNVFFGVTVKGLSMYPSLKEGDCLIVNSKTTPDYGDIIIISGEENDGDWLIKRLIAKGGDTVKIANACVYLKKSGETDFTQLQEDYLSKECTYYPRVYNSTDIEEHIFEIEEGQFFYLGDNRTNSLDSRTNFGEENEEFGTCYDNQVLGVVSNFSLKCKGVITFFSKISSSIKSFIRGLFS